MHSFEFHHIVDSSKQTPLTVLAKHCDLTHGQIKSAIQKGALWYTRKGQKPQRTRRIKKSLTIGDELHFYYNPQVLAQTTEDAELIADHKDYSVWWKPYGMLSQGSKWSDHLTITRWAQLHLPNDRPCFIVHRLDRATSGLIIVAHSKKAAQAFSQLFELRQLTKTYQAICHGNEFSQDTNSLINIEQPLDGKSAISQFELLSYQVKENLSLVSVTIGTGRKHQIRKHAQMLNMPIVGDRLYGDDNQDIIEEINLQLCAVSLEFICPLTQQNKYFQVPDIKKPSIARLIVLLNSNKH